MKSNRRILSAALTLAIIFVSVFSVNITAFADDELRYFERGVLTDGTNTAYYIIDKDNKVLYITGDGNNLAYTPDYPRADQGPFAGRTDITRIVIEEDVARIGDYALSNMTKVDTLEVQSNLLSSSSSMSSKAMIGCTGLRHIQGDSALLSTDVFLQVVKGALNIASGNWLSLIANGVSIISTGVNGDDTLDNDTVHCMVDDYINSGNKIFLGDLDEAKAEYNERLANPCYSNNAFHHNYSSSVTGEPTCTENGVRTYTCSVCGDEYTENIDALGHTYTDSVLYAPSCFVEGIEKHYCTRCGSATYEAIPAYGHHTYDSCVYDSVNDAYTEICSVCNGRNTQFDNDTSVLIYAADCVEALDAEDYVEEDYSALYELSERYFDLEESDYLQYPQYKIDEKVADIITGLDSLRAYLRLSMSKSTGGDVTVSAGGEDSTVGSRRIISGTEVTLTASPSEGSAFIGWYEKTTKRYLSTDTVFTFAMTSNTDIIARFATSDDATLYFECLDGQIKKYYSKTLAQWDAINSLDTLLPEIPYSYGHCNGSWVYNESEALEALRSGNDYTVHVSYDTVQTPVYTVPVSDDGVTPALELHYEYDVDANVGNFIMVADVPENCDFVEIGIAFYYRDASVFSPSAFRLTLNNKMVTSRFEQRNPDGKYIVNFKKMSSAKNYAARGYVSYYDSNGDFRIAYTDQINVVNLSEI